MADDEKEKDGALAEDDAESSDDGGLLDGDDDLMSLFTEEAEVNESLSALAGLLDEVFMDDLMVQVREIQDIIDQRRAA